MEAKLQELKTRLLEIGDLESAAAVLEWDQSTYMPPGGALARGRQLATLRGLAHAKFADPAVGKLLDDLRSLEEGLPYDSDEASLIRVTRRDYERAIRVPAAFVAEINAHFAASFQAWTVARPANDFAKMVPYLEKSIDYTRRLAGFFPGYDNIRDPLLEYVAHEGLSAAEIGGLFAALRAQLVPMVAAIARRPAPDDSALHLTYPEPAQLTYGLEVVKRLGYDFERGREDKTYHPFSTRFAWGDVRITTRVRERSLGVALFGTIHEAGHAMYEQGTRPELDGTPLGRGTSAGMHESQSRMWENVVGRSRPFWQFFYPKLQAVFSSQLGAVPLDTFYRAINKVQPSLIRVEADEVTYNLHIMHRWDLEEELLNGRLAVRDLPEAWNARFRADLGIVPPNHHDGVLQDVHWYGFMPGPSYQGYALGNLINAQLYETVLAAHPELPDEFARGEFGTLHAWLRENIYQHGGKYTMAELVRRVTGRALGVDALARYLRAKYGELYAL